MKKIKWWIFWFALGQAAVLWYKDKNLQKKVAKAPTFGKKVKTFFDGWLWANKEMIADVKEFDYEGTWEDVKSWFQHEVDLLEEKMKELEEKITERKEKANDTAHKKAQEVSDMIQEHIADVQAKMTGKWDEVNEKYQVEEKVHALKKQYDHLKKQLQK